ncbi:MAG: tetratricopeptide repeat protein [Chitinophagales bacterium]
MSPKEQIEQQFEAVKKGNYAAITELFDTIWLNHTNLAHTGIASLLDKIYAWAKSHEAKHPEFLAFATLALGTIAHHSDNFDEAMQQCTTAHKLFSDLKDEDGMAAAEIYIGFIYRSMGEIDLAFKFGLEGIERLAQSGKHKMLLIIGYYWVGGIFAETAQYDEAIQFFNRGLNVNYPEGLVAMKARFINGIAGVYMREKKYEIALENYKKALDSSDEREPTFKARGLTDLGDYYFKLGDYSQAIKYNEEALAIRQEMNILNGSITNLINLGNILNGQGKYTEAIDMLKRALKLSEEIKVKSKMYHIHQLLSNIFLATNNLSESLAHYIAFHEIREDVSHEDSERKVKNQQKLFEAKQTQKENAIIKAQKVEIEHKNKLLEDTIEELTITKVSRRAKAITLVIAFVLIVIDTTIHHFVVSRYAHNNYFLLLASEGMIVLLMKPIEKTVEHYLLQQVVKRKRMKMMAELENAEV